MGTEIVLLLALALLLAWAGLLWTWRETLCRQWIEPVLRRPVLIVESDDWGPGPPLHGERLARLADTLAQHRDGSGHSALMTLGVVLAVPDGAAMRSDDLQDYRRLELDDPRCDGVLAAMEQGAAKGVFALQLHGMEHYWPPALLRAAQGDASLRAWLEQAFPAYEELPSPLQSRWVDGAQLPSGALDADSIARAVREETQAFQRIFRFAPRVVVPPTFIWNRTVETAWMAAGIEVIITPGRRYTGRDAAGQPTGVETSLHNGEAAGPMALYLVRDIYFEPLRGHAPAKVLEDAHLRFRLGRPALLETHRSNFIGAEAEFRHSLAQLDNLFGKALRDWPDLRFLSPEALARRYRERPADWCARAWPVRLHVWMRRLAAIPRLRKLAWLSGLALPAALLLWLTAAPARRAGLPA
jgi:hypothetical protein